MRDDAGGSGAGPDPRRIDSAAELVRELALLRVRGARGSQRLRVSLNELARATGIPRSTVHAYLQGSRLPPPDSLDRIVVALGARADEQREWAEALYRVTGEAQLIDPAPGRAGAPVPRQLPAAPRGFVGRDAECGEMDGLLADSEGSAPLLAVIGTGGVGKTALVLHWAHRNLKRFPDGQLWIDLRGFGSMAPMEPGDALDRLLRAIGASNTALPADVEARSALFRTALADRRMLLVLDNARSAAQVLPLLPATPGVVTIVTSRDTLRPLVASLGADRVRVERLPEAASLSLLAADGIADRLAVARIARCCEGLPLALRIVRERLSSASPAETTRFAEDLDRDRSRRLAALDLDDASVEVSVRGALRWSYEALAPDAAGLFRRLPLCLATTFDRADAAVLLDRPERAGRLLDTLVAASLLDTAGDRQYRLHELVAGFAAECLHQEEAPAEVSRLRLAFARHLAQMAEAALLLWDAHRPPRTEFPAGHELPPLDPVQVFGTVEAAQDWVMNHIDAIAAAVPLMAGSNEPAYSWLLADRGNRALWAIADTTMLDSALALARSVAEQRREPVAAIVMSRLLGVSCGRRGQLEAAEEAFRHGIQLAEANDLPRFAVLDRANLGLIAGMRGELERAIGIVTEAVGQLRQVGEEPISSLHSLAEFELQRGNVAAAAEWLRQMRAEAIFADRSSSQHLDVQVMTAQVALAAGDLAGAHIALDLADRLVAGGGQRDVLGQCRELRGRAFRDAGQLGPAEACGREALAIAHAMAGRSAEIAALCLLGDIARRQQDTGEAERLLGEALQRSREAGLRHPEAEALVLLARVYDQVGDRVRLRRLGNQARELTERCGFTGLRRALDGLTG